MRSIWKGYIQFSLVTVPIRIYNAVDTEETIRFNQLHKEDHGPVGYDKKCKKCSKTLSADEIVKGYQFEPEQFVVVTAEDMAKVKLKSTKVIEIQGFIDASEVESALYDAPYYASPDGPIAAKTYSLLSQALNAAGKVGIGKVVLRDREEVMLIAPKNNGLMLHKLRRPTEIKSFDQVPQLETRPVSKDELKLSINLVESMATSLKDLDLSDRYRDALREMIEAKISGKQVVSVPEEAPPVIDLMAALRESIEQTKAQRKPMAKAGTRKNAAEPARKDRKQKVA